MTHFRYLLLQVRNPNDPMRKQEVDCFARALDCRREQIEVIDLIRRAPSASDLAGCDVVLLGGSGDYSVASGGVWLEEALAAMQKLYEVDKPTFASCWGFQAMARALGGVVVTDPARAEIGTLNVRLTPEAAADPLFNSLSPHFLAQMGHQDIVDRLPKGAVRLASSEKVENQAFCFPNKSIYCTQFHPELDREAMVARLRNYPRYVESIAAMPLSEFELKHCHDTPEANRLLRRFMELVAGNRNR